MNGKEFALGEYRVGELIAEGGFGFVYSGHAPDATPVAIKYERTYDRIKRPYLKHEADVYRLLHGNTCIPTVYAYDRDERWNIMIFDLLGESLQKLFEECGKRFSLKTTLMLGIQMLECIEYVHSNGIIHRDIKPDNFLIGRGKHENNVHIIDFGLARRYKHPETNEHFPFFEDQSFFGTTRYASLNAQLHRSQSRRDDLESLAYSLIQFLRGRLPWQHMRGGTNKHKEERVKEKKRTWTPERLCAGLPKEFESFLSYIKKLEYEEQPDYDFLKTLLRGLFDKEGYLFDYVFDWKTLNENVQAELRSNPSSYSQGTSANRNTVPEEGKQSVENGTTSAYSTADESESGSCPPQTSSENNEPEKALTATNSQEIAVKAGSFVLLRVLARPTLEYADPIWEAKEEDEETDNSYYHQPSFSKSEWKFKWRPAIVTDFSYGTGRCKLNVMPLMVRNKGLADIPERRHKAFVRIASDISKENRATESDAEVMPSPTWPLQGTYSFLQFEEYSIYVWTEDIRDVKVYWSLDAAELASLRGRREAEGVAAAIYDLIQYDDEDEETRFVKRGLCKPSVVGGNPIFGDIASLDEAALTARADVDVDLTGAHGFLPETFKIEERRERENGYQTSVSGDTTQDLNENVSLYTGPVPGDRPKSCTIGINPDDIFQFTPHEDDPAPIR